jgi:hypothetical protein
LEEDEIGIRTDNLGRNHKTGGSNIWAVDTKVGDLGRAGGVEGHLDEFAGARFAVGEVGVAVVVTHIAKDVEENPVWGGVAIALREWRRTQNGRGEGG